MTPGQFLQKLEDEHPASRMIDGSIFRRAAEHIRLHGWLREDYGVAYGPCCLMGAVKIAIEERLEAEQIEDDLMEYERIAFAKAIKTVRRVLDPEERTSVYQWNDSRESSEPVLALLDKLAGEGA